MSACFGPFWPNVFLATIRKGSHVLVEGALASSTYEQSNGNGKSKKAKAGKAAKLTSWSIRADVVRRLDRGEPEPEAPAPTSEAAEPASDASEATPF